MIEVPTLLIGLGGIGSRVVNEIYGLIPEGRNSRIAVHVFDTNVNDISKLKNLNKDWRTQTSKDLTVEQYLSNLSEEEQYVKDWFPHEEREIRRKSLTEGAGQVRAISRLAYRAAMQEGKLNSLQRQLTSIFREVGDSEVKSARVMIICSLAGGTGGGIFLQTAMYLRHILKHDYKRENLLIRGAFLLPDVLALSGTVTQGEMVNIRANAYACLKELNAIIKNTNTGAGEASTDRVEIELEYMPNQRDAGRRLNHAITSDQLPYDFCFLYDFENTAKNNLQFAENYYNQVVQCTYLELFSPISADKFSRQDNQILELVQNQGLNRYCGAGMSRLVYPYENLIRYFALKWASDSLSSDWLKLDDDFDKEYRQYEIDLQNGVTREEPKICERYPWLLDNYANDEPPLPFFRMVHRGGFTIGKQNEIENPKSGMFIDSVNELIDDVIKKDKKINDMQADCQIDENRLKDKDRIASEVSKIESALASLESEVNKFVRESKTFIVNQVLLQDCEAQRFTAGKDYQLSTWLLKKNDPVHPVTVRYVLYQIYNLLDESLKTMNSENPKLNQSIVNYQKAYDSADTEDVVEDAHERLRRALNQSSLKKLIKNELKEFIGEYYEKANRQQSNLIKFKKNKLMELVYVDLKNSIREMLEDWERYFRNLRNIRNNLLQDVNKMAVAEQNAGDPTVKYILASKDMKEKMWDSVRSMVRTQGIPGEVCEQIYAGQYRRFCAKRKNEYITDDSIEKVETMFRRDVVAWCETELNKVEALNLNCIQALRKESQLEKISGDAIEKSLEEKVKMLDRLARPFVPETINANHLDAWGVHPDNIAELTGERRNEWFGTELIEDTVFNIHEIIRYKSNYNMKINDFNKFSSGDAKNNLNSGVYYTAYMDRINQLTTRHNTVTPHLDKRWHVLAFLPDLNPQKAIEEENVIGRALILGLILGYLRSVDIYGDVTWELFEENNSRLVKIGDKMADEYTYALHKALKHNPVIVDKVMQLFSRQSRDDKRDYPENVSEHSFYTGAFNIFYFPLKKSLNILDILYKYSDDNPGDESLLTKEIVLLNCLLDEIFIYFESAIGRHKKTLADNEAEKFIQRLIDESIHIKGSDRTSRRFQQWDNIIQNKIKTIRKTN